MKTRILLVEDDTRLADLTAEYLRKNDFEVTVESRGDTAEARILHDNPGLVILDVMLPGKDGFEVCRAVREKYEGVILMLTARDEDLDQILGLELGADVPFFVGEESFKEVLRNIVAKLFAQFAAGFVSRAGVVFAGEICF